MGNQATSSGLKREFLFAVYAPSHFLNDSLYLSDTFESVARKLQKVTRSFGPQDVVGKMRAPRDANDDQLG